MVAVVTWETGTVCNERMDLAKISRQNGKSVHWFLSLNFLFELSLHSLCPFKVFVTGVFLFGNLDPCDTTCKYISKFAVCLVSLLRVDCHTEVVIIIVIM